MSNNLPPPVPASGAPTDLAPLRSRGSLRSLDVEERELLLAARSTAMPAALASMLAVAGVGVALWLNAIPALFHLLAGILPRLSAAALTNSLCLVLPLLAPLALAAVLRTRVVAATRRSQDLGRAAASGACLAAASGGVLALGGAAAMFGSLNGPGQVLLWVAGVPLGLAFSVGLLGAMLFRDVSRIVEDESESMPALYPGLVAAGVIGPAAMMSLFFGSFLIVPLWSWIGFSSLSVAARVGLWMAASYTFFLPMAFLVPRGVRGVFPGASNRALAAGVAIPGVLYACSDLYLILIRTSGLAQLALLVFLVAGVSSWAALAVFGALPDEPEVSPIDSGTGVKELPAPGPGNSPK